VFFTELSRMNDVAAACQLCITPQAHLDVALMLYGPVKAAETYKMSLTAANRGGVLDNHWRHLQRAMLMPLARMAPPSEDADPVTKTRWAQRKLFNLCFSADETPPVDTAKDVAGYVNTIRTKNAILGTLLGAVRLEAELLGNLETAKQLGKRRADKEIAKDEELMSEEERLQLAKASLRAKGYQISKSVEQETVDITEGETDAEVPTRTAE